MGIKFKSPLALSAHRAIAHSDSAQTLEVKVVTKTAAHPEFGNGSANGYTIDGVEGAYLEFTPGNTYKFDQADSSNATHPLRFYEDAAKTTAYTTGVTTNGTPGSSGAYTQIIPTTTTPPILFYQCSAHSLMGSYVKFGTGTVGDTYSIDVTQDGDNVDLKLDAASGTDSTVQFTAGTNVTLTRNDAQQVTIAASGGGITVQEEGSSLSTPATTLNFTGAAVTASGSGATKTIDVTGGAITVQEEGSSLSTAATTLNFTGSAVTASGSGAVKTINVTGGSVVTTELSIERNVFTATANQTAFTISSAITASSNTQVYIDGVYQAKSNYTTSGSTITFSTGVSAGSEVEVIHFISVLSKVYTDTFTGDGTTVDFTASKDVTDENVTQVYIDGVYQSKDNYTTSGTTITFSTAPPSGSAIEVVHFTPATYSTLNSNQFTGTGSQTNFTLTQAVEEDKSFVFIQGIYQEKSTYSIAGTTLTFTTAPTSGSTIEVITIGSISVFNDTLYLDNFNGTGSQVNYTLSTSPANENAIDVYINGLYQQKDTFSLAGSTLTFSTAPPNGSTIEVKSTGGLNNVAANITRNFNVAVISSDTTAVSDTLYVLTANLTLTLPASPSNGNSVKISNRSGVTTCVIARNGNKIMGSASDLTIDKLNSGFELIYAGSAQGWVLIGVEGA